MRLINWFLGQAGQELTQSSISKSWSFDDLLWAINISVCSKPLEEPEDIREVVELLFELNPYLLLNMKDSSSLSSIPKSYGEPALNFLLIGKTLDESQLPLYIPKLSLLLKSRLDFSQSFKPSIYQYLCPLSN